jgi:hypothetical protein
MKTKYLQLDRDGGGQLILPLDEVVIISALTLNKGTEETPDWQVDETKSVVRVRTLGIDIVLAHAVQDLAKLFAIVEVSDDGAR